MLDQLGIPFAETRVAKRYFPDKIGPPRNVERTSRQRLVHRRISRAITRDAALFTQRLQHRLANRDAGVFGGVMLVDIRSPMALTFKRSASAATIAQAYGPENDAR